MVPKHRPSDQCQVIDRVSRPPTRVHDIDQSTSKVSEQVFSHNSIESVESRSAVGERTIRVLYFRIFFSLYSS